MMKLTRLTRAIAVTAAMAAGAMSVAPAFAAGEVELLKEYVGDWRGRGTMTGANTETVVCRLSMQQGNADKINYAGRCTLAGTTLSINGTVAFIGGRFEAAMTSNASFTGTAIGRKRGDTIVFDLKEKQKGDDGSDMDVTASMVLGGGKINVNFKVVFPKTGDSIVAQVPFNK